MFQQADCLSLDKLVDHVAQNHANGIETLVSVANVRQPRVVQEDLLHDEDGHGFGELGTFLHDAQAEGDELGGEE